MRAAARTSLGPRRTRRILAALAVACGLALPASSLAAPALPLGHAGRWSTDARGRVVILHGLNMVAKLGPYAPDATGFGDDDAAFLARNGFDAVRVGVIYKAVEPRPGVYDDAYLRRIARTVRTLARHGIVSMLDFHQDLFNERFQGEGFPDWAALDDGLPALPRAGFPANYLVMPALQRAFDHFWENSRGPGGVPLQDRFAAAWRHVAGRFAGDRGVLGYELLNEPWPGTVWQPCAVPAGCPAFDAALTAFDRRVARAIRRADRRTLIWYEPNVLFNNGPVTHVGSLRDPRAGFAFHDYCLQATEASANPAVCRPADDRVFANAQRHVAATREAILLTEFGATRNADTLTTMLRRADRARVGWLEWAYCGCSDPTTSGPGDTQALVRDPARPPAGANVEAAKLAILAEPYPQVVSGTPLRYGFRTAGRVFALRWTAARAGGGRRFGAGAETDVAVPAIQYPRAYAVRARGAAIASRPRARVLRLLACPGARTLSVTVRPGAGARGSCRAAAAHRRRLPRPPSGGRG